MSRSDGSTADYYVLPEGATQLQDLISHRDMNSQIGEIFRACYRYGIVSHSDKMRDAKKIRFYAQAEVERLEKLEFDPTTMPIIELKAVDDAPSWDEAPKHMQWRAQDGHPPFAWVFFENKPIDSNGSWIQDSGKWLNTGPSTKPADYAATLQSRPQ